MNGRSSQLARFPATLAVIAVALAGCTSRGPESKLLSFEGFNVLLVSLDTLRADRLGAYGYDAPTSPVLDRLARDAVVCPNVLAQSPTTAPSHRSLFSGLYVNEHRNEQLGFPVMAELFREAGWATAAFVDGGHLGAGFGFERGFELYRVTNPAFASGGPDVGGGLAALLPPATAWLRDVHERPFFLFVHTYDIHCPYTPPTSYRQRFAGDFDPGFEVDGKCGDVYFNQLGLGSDGFSHLSNLYDGGVRHADRLLRELFLELERLGIAERTLVVVTSDHGESLGERRWVGHNQVYDLQLKVPLIFRLPGRGPAVMSAPVQSIDVLPTLLSLVGIESEAVGSGIDLSDGLLGRSDLPPHRFRLGETWDGTIRTVRTDDRWSLVLREDLPIELHDLTADPTEVRNLIGREPEIAEDLYDELEVRGLDFEKLSTMPTGLDEATRRRLEALGYTGGRSN